jgi:hypothetical protein
MNNTVAFMVIPTFHVALNDADALAASIRRIKQGNGRYTIQDIQNLSDWIGICTFQFMADRFEEKYQKPVTAAELNNCQLYYNHCRSVGRITNDLLKKAKINFSWCSTFIPSQATITHSSIMADICPVEVIDHATVFYDSAIRQYFDTDTDGKVKEQTIWSNSAGKFVAFNLLKTETGHELIEELASTGSMLTTKVHMTDYIKAFSFAFNQSGYESTKAFTDDELIDHFLLNNNDAIDKTGYYSAYTKMPGETGFKKRANELLDFQRKLHL